MKFEDLVRDYSISSLSTVTVSFVLFEMRTLNNFTLSSHICSIKIGIATFILKKSKQNVSLDR